MVSYTLENRLLHGQDSVYNVTNKLRTKQTTVFRPIANLRFLYKTFVAFLLGGSEQIVDAQHPEGQHDFRAGRRLEEHFLSANIVLDKAEATGFRVWNISLELSKALRTALFEQGIPEHLIWILRRACYRQRGEIASDFGQSD